MKYVNNVRMKSCTLEGRKKVPQEFRRSLEALLLCGAGGKGAEDGFVSNSPVVVRRE